MRFRAVKVDEVKSVLDRSAALAEYARRAKDAELIARATEPWLYAVRRQGEILALLRQLDKLAKGTRGARRRKGGVTKTPPHETRLSIRASTRSSPRQRARLRRGTKRSSPRRFALSPPLRTTRR
jgi:hypothetical protein